MPLTLLRKPGHLPFTPQTDAIRSDLYQTRILSLHPGALKDAPQYLLDNPIALQKQRINKIVSLYEKSQEIESKITNTLAQMNQASAKKAEIVAKYTPLGRASSDRSIGQPAGPLARF